MADEKYIRHDYHSIIAHLVEECGEVQFAAGKLLRWGPLSRSPMSGADSRNNETWLLAELHDLEAVIRRFKRKIEDTTPNERHEEFFLAPRP